MSTDKHQIPDTTTVAIPDYVEDELNNYEQQIQKYREGQLDETKMQSCDFTSALMPNVRPVYRCCGSKFRAVF
jgi:hypothetical protein